MRACVRACGRAGGALVSKSAIPRADIGKDAVIVPFCFLGPNWGQEASQRNYAIIFFFSLLLFVVGCP